MSIRRTFTSMAIGAWLVFPLLWVFDITPSAFTTFWAAFWTILAIVTHMER